VATSSKHPRSYRRAFSEPTEKVTVRLPLAIIRALRQEARERQVTITKVVFDHLCAQQQLQAQVAAVFTLGPTEDGAAGTHILHVLLERFKDEIARSIDAQAAAMTAVREQQRVTQAMIDRAYYGFVLHTPRVLPERRAQAIAEAADRYQKYIDDVSLMLTPQPRERGRYGTTDAQTPTADRAAGQTPAGAGTSDRRRPDG